MSMNHGYNQPLYRHNGHGMTNTESFIQTGHGYPHSLIQQNIKPPTYSHSVHQLRHPSQGLVGQFQHTTPMQGYRPDFDECLYNPAGSSVRLTIFQPTTKQTSNTHVKQQAFQSYSALSF